ncbi:WXG100 family type VII secretion target [Nocardia beijingensis]|uniref:WXG100 family type VII secretion target n=1 Tax=Nocardia beijingensis TaxID=95162 RepID=A0ABW7WLD0_9NOCA
MSVNPYPNLGFDPVPGTPDEVANLRGQIDSARQGVTETRSLLNRLIGSDDVWKGDAGNAFRTNFDATLSSDLGYAQQSLEQAVDLLNEWHTNLVSYHDTAKGLDQQAADARAQHTQAVSALQQARSNPDLGLANVQFNDPDELRAAQIRLNNATAQVNAAVTAVDDCQGKIDAIIRRARDLESTHSALAGRIAAALDAAAKDFAPSPPDKSIWDRITDAIKAVGDWIDEHREGLHEFLSCTAAIAGLLAVVTPPPVDAIALGVALAAGAGALALDVTDAEMRDDLLHGSLSERLSAGLTISGDAMGLIPGVGALGKVGKVALLGDAVGDIGRFESMARTWSEAAHNPGLVNKFMTDHNVGNVTNVLSSTGATNGVNRLLQFTGVEGAHSVADPAVALTVLKRGEGAVSTLAGTALDHIFGG